MRENRSIESHDVMGRFLLCVISSVDFACYSRRQSLLAKSSVIVDVNSFNSDFANETRSLRMHGLQIHGGLRKIPA